MTKLIVPQIGDIVRGQVVTEAAHKLWVDLVDKVDTIESGNLGDSISDLESRIEELQAQLDTRPKITKHEGTLTFAPLEDGYDWYDVQVIFEFNLDASDIITVGIQTNITAYPNYAFRYFPSDADEPRVRGSVNVSVARQQLEDFSDGTLKLYAILGTSTVFTDQVNVLNWIVHKYKSEY